MKTKIISTISQIKLKAEDEFFDYSDACGRDFQNLVKILLLDQPLVVWHLSDPESKPILQINNLLITPKIYWVNITEPAEFVTNVLENWESPTKEVIFINLDLSDTDLLLLKEKKKNLLIFGISEMLNISTMDLNLESEVIKFLHGNDIDPLTLDKPIRLEHL